MVHFKVVKTPAQLIKENWENFLKILDVVGLWHYSRTMPERANYEILFQNDEKMVVRSTKTRSHFIFYPDWKIYYHQLNGADRLSERKCIEGQLSSAFDYIETLLNIGAVERHL